MNERSFSPFIIPHSAFSIPMPSSTRQAILEAAFDLFSRQGYHGTSMRQIARQANIALGGIYNHFPNKEALFAEVLDAYHPYHDILPALREDGDSPPADLPAFLHRAAERTRQVLNERPAFVNLMLIELVEFDASHMPPLYAALQEQTVPLVERFVQAGAALRDIPIPVMVRAFIGTLISYVITERSLDGNLTASFGEDYLENLVDIFLYGILSPSADTP